jgi:hypothetical protein
MPASPVPRCVRALARQPPQPARHQKIPTHTPVPERSVRPLAERVTDRRLCGAFRVDRRHQGRLRLGIIDRTPGGGEDMTAGPFGRHRVAVAGVWDWRPPKPRHHRRRCRLPAENWPQVERTYRSAVRCPVLTKDVDGRASAGGSSDSGSSTDAPTRAVRSEWAAM